jgi:hypothetical protein
MHEPEELPPLDLDFESAFEDGETVDMTAVLLRRFAWDTMPCPLVNDLLTKLGLTHGSEEGQEVDHRESHQRLAAVWPLEQFFRRFSEVLGVVAATAMLQAKGIELEGDQSVQFANQNASVILASARAMVAQLMYSGLLQYGPAVNVVTIVEADDV